MKRFHVVRALAAAAVMLVAWPVAAEIKLPSIIGDNMVLQREQEVPIWGWVDANAQVTVTLGDKSATATADGSGKWLVKLPAMQAGGPHTVRIESGDESKELKDVLVGEVWVCSGQSNMEWTVAKSDNPEQEIAAANHPQIRHIKIPRTPAATPQNNVESSGWTPATPETVAEFTAVGYYFARNLQEELNVPVGIIGSNWGGTRIEPWTPPVGFKQVPALKDIAENLEQYPEKRPDGTINQQTPLALYNGMIHPLLPYAIRGAIWYQGEANVGEGMLYHEKMKALIEGWRSVWNRPDLPFLFVQLAPFRYRNADPQNLPRLWEAQQATLSVPNTGMAVTVDIGNVEDIHPRNKQDVGKRLALWALATVYGREGIVYSGPLYKSMKVDGNKVLIQFEHTGGGLVARDNQPLTNFQIAGEDRKFVDAMARIDGDTVVVQSDEVSKPVAVRFAWDQEAEPNLSNTEGLPAAPFRTDNW